MIKGLIKWMMMPVVLWGMSGCGEQAPVPFGEVNGVYFNNRLANGELTDSVSVTFVYTSGDVMEVPVVVQLLGRPAGVARPVGLRVASDNAKEGEDYVLKTAAEMPADTTVLEYVVELRRTEALKQESRWVDLELVANDHFTLPLRGEVQAGGDTTSILRYRIVFTDRFTVAPEGWNEAFGGEFSQQKFELICRVLEIDPAEFSVKNGVSLPKWSYIQMEMTAYVQEQVALKEAGEPYDAEAFDKEDGQPLVFTKKE